MNAHGDEPMPATTNHCIWMDAGVVGYKLCDRDYQCDQCPFDVVMRQPFQKPACAAVSAPRESTKERPHPVDRTPGEQLEEVLNSLFLPLMTVPFPDDRIFHKGRTWVQRSAENEMRVGMDHIGAGILDSLVTIVLPQRGSRLTENTPFCWLIQPEGTITMYAPLSGTALSVNTLLALHPELTLTDPYGQGWIVCVQPEEPEFRSRDFLNGEDLSKDSPLRFLRNQIADRCQQSAALGATLADGGVALETVAALVGRKAFLHIVGRMFHPKSGVTEEKL